MKTHGIPAQDWQLQAAANGTLQAIVLPLLPEIETCPDGWRYWKSPIYDTMLAFSPDDVPFSYAGSYSQLIWQVGDRIFLQEEWCERDKECVYWVQPDCESTWLRWRSAKDMPIEAAQYQFKITRVKIIEGKNLVTEKICPDCDYQTFKNRWNAAYPGQPWDGDRYIVVLSLEEIKT
jgi:hypothetical protein